MNANGSCPCEHELVEYCSGRLEPARAEEVQQHLEECETCSRATKRIKAQLSPLIDNDAFPSSLALESTVLLATQEGELEEASIDHLLFSEPQDARAMGRLGKYDVFRLIGRGGMGVVFQAQNEQLRRDVAIKILNRSLSASPVARRRFIREARAAAAISHPNVVIIHDVDEHRGMPYIVMELVTGRTLRAEIRSLTTLDPLRVIRLSAQIAQGLASAHAQGVIHRDIKPGNIMLEHDVDRVKITDFGLARAAIDNVELTSRELAVGTPAYMSPEQIAGKEVDGRSDLFAMGCVMYALLTGHSPFHGHTALEMARKVETHNPRNLHVLDSSIPKFLADIVEKLLQKDPEARFQSAAEVADILNRHLAALNQAPSNQLAYLLNAGELDKNAPPKRPWRLLQVGGVLFMMIAVSAVLGIALLRPDVLGGSRGPAAKDEIEKTSLADSTTIPNEITVSKLGEADFPSLREALAAVDEKNTMVRVLDDATYQGPCEIGGAKHEGLQLISEQQATLEVPADMEAEHHTISLRGASDVIVKGFNIVANGNGHAVFVGGTARGVVLENLHCESLATDGPHATVQIYISSVADGHALLRMTGCRITNRGLSQCVWIHEPSHDVEITGNLFSAHETALALWDSCRRLTISHNVFLQGQDGISLAILKWPDDCHIQISNNTFFGSNSWVSFAGDSLSQGKVEIVNNLILGCERLGMSDEQLPLAPDAWRFRCNHWERGAHTAANAGQDGRIARMHEIGELTISRDANDADFLMPAAGSDLLTSGAGNGYPPFVGAKDRSD